MGLNFLSKNKLADKGNPSWVTFNNK